MFEAIIRTFLGSLSPILDYIQNNPMVVSLVLGIYIAIYFAGRLQLETIKRKTTEMVLAYTREELKKKPNITSGGIFKHIYPLWEKEVGTWVKFIPHRTDLFPVPATAAAASKKLPFTPEWLVEVLKENKIELAEFKPEEITPTTNG
ncbi:MAG: hypothetical protein HGA53_01100 [Anaerolineaceae bacterium]|nr:hypothetical protein [Anaerolineaceae bacterium]